MGGNVTLLCSAEGRWGKSKALFMVEVGALEVEGCEDVFRKALG